MKTNEIAHASAEDLAPVLLAALQRLGELGRTGAIELQKLVDDGDAEFDEAASWIASINEGEKLAG